MASAIQVPLLNFHIGFIIHYQLAYAQATDKYWSHLWVVFQLVWYLPWAVFIQSFIFVYVDSPSVRCGWKYGWGEGRKQDGEGEAIPLGHSSRSVEVTITHIWGTSTERWCHTILLSSGLGWLRVH